MDIKISPSIENLLTQKTANAKSSNQETPRKSCPPSDRGPSRGSKEKKSQGSLDSKLQTTATKTSGWTFLIKKLFRRQKSHGSLERKIYTPLDAKTDASATRTSGTVNTLENTKKDKNIRLPAQNEAQKRHVPDKIARSVLRNNKTKVVRFSSQDEIRIKKQGASFKKGVSSKNPRRQSVELNKTQVVPYTEDIESLRESSVSSSPADGPPVKRRPAQEGSIKTMAQAILHSTRNQDDNKPAPAVQIPSKMVLKRVHMDQQNTVEFIFDPEISETASLQNLSKVQNIIVKHRLSSASGQPYNDEKLLISLNKDVHDRPVAIKTLAISEKASKNKSTMKQIQLLTTEQTQQHDLYVDSGEFGRLQKVRSKTETNK